MGANRGPREDSGAAGAIRRAAGADLKAITRMLVLAYMQDPVAMWMCPSEHLRAKTLHALYSPRLRQLLACGEIWTDPSCTSAAVWLAPEAEKPAVRLEPGLLRCLLDPRLMVRLPLLGLGFARMERAHPHGPPHWYLSLLGTDPAAQGQGRGSAVLRPVLERCDAEDVGAYLESSNPRNLGLYTRHGFRELEPLQLPAGPTLTRMWREPRSDVR
jgi:ribosomal protein S18 acetylase RimI-like enzyme